MKATSTILVIVLVAMCDLLASGPIGLYGIVEKVVFEPTDAAPERIQVWGAFAYVDRARSGPGTVSAAKRGYLYFKLPDLVPGFTSQSDIDVIKKEWADLKAVAGTGQAIAFGTWGYIAGFDALQPDQRPTPPSVILHRVPGGGDISDLRVRPASESPRAPATYQTNAGIVKLSDQGSHTAIVKQLKEALKAASRPQPRP
jgi:hypothetical protein